jgi:putative tricarboxylic transport membrane protein
VQGLILLGAAYTSTVAGGAVSAILLKIPGAPANIATTLDGHEMARRGNGARALQLSFLASAVGGVIGVLLLIFLTPVLSRWALAFGPSHLFWLAILGVTIIGSLESRSVVKGLLSGCIGLWLATIGFDDIMGAQRFIFHPALGGGVNIIAALIGIFAIPQVLNMFAKGRRQVDMEVIEVRKSPIREAFAEILRRPRALSIGTVTGAVVGLIPGVGGQIAGLVAYDQSRKLSKEPRKFGTGHSEGIIAAESANNAMVGPSLVPLLTLSIPGSPTAAVLLGGLLIHGIFPGSDLFENYPDVAWTFINSMLIGQILMCIFGLYVAGLAAKVAKVPQSVMAAVVLGLAVFGSYSVQSSMGDVYVMAALGIMMFFLERFGYSAAPLVLGLILGPIAEANFIQGTMIADASDGRWAYFFSGPLNIALIATVVLSVAYSAWMEIRSRRIDAEEALA